MSNLSYPIGQFVAVQEPTDEQRKQFIASIAVITDELRQAIEGLTAEQLTTPYRSEGWTVQQVVHHLADAGMNAYFRFKRGLTEDLPLAGTFREDLWAELNDYRDEPVDTSVLLLEALHKRFVTLLVALNSVDFKRSVRSPTHGEMTLDAAVQRYSWHARHHIAQVTSLRERSGW